VLTALSKNERISVMKKGEIPITSSDEAEIVHAHSLTAPLANRAAKDKD
jgi:hypothetical protein